MVHQTCSVDCTPQVFLLSYVCYFLTISAICSPRFSYCGKYVIFCNPIMTSTPEGHLTGGIPPPTTPNTGISTHRNFIKKSSRLGYAGKDRRSWIWGLEPASCQETSIPMAHSSSGPIYRRIKSGKQAACLKKRECGSTISSPPQKSSISHPIPLIPSPPASVFSILTLYAFFPGLQIC